MLHRFCRIPGTFRNVIAISATSGVKTQSLTRSFSTGTGEVSYGAKVKIYTKTGDKGTSTLYNMQRISKSADYFHCLGDVDELNAHIGLARHFAVEADNGLDEKLEWLQSRLLDLGACIATPLTSSPENRIAHTEFDGSHIDTLETWIDEFDARLPTLTKFILPSGGACAGTLHIARTVCRRAERMVVPLVDRGDMEAVPMRFLNRLSDFLFIAARIAAQHEGKAEVIYKKPSKRRNRHAVADADAAQDPK